MSQYLYFITVCTYFYVMFQEAFSNVLFNYAFQWRLNGVSINLLLLFQVQNWFSFKLFRISIK